MPPLRALPALLLFLLASCKAVPSPDDATGPVISDAQGRIAFVGISSSANLQVILVRPNGSGVVTATGDSADFDTPAWSPDGKRIALATNVSGREDPDIYVLDLEARTLEPVVASPAHETHPDWSPDGTRLAYQRRDASGGSWSIHTVSLTGQAAAVTAHLTGSHQYPDWSPDGMRLLFERTDSGTTRIEVILADGTGHAVLTRPQEGLDGAPVWSPDGTRIAFESTRHFPRSDLGYFQEYDIYVMSATGESIRRVTDFSTRNRSMRFPHWSPDGAYLAFESRELNPTFGSILYRMLTTSPAGENAAFIPVNRPGRYPRWAPIE